MTYQQQEDSKIPGSPEHLKLRSEPSLEQQVRELAKDKCQNCGGDDRTVVHLVVPTSVGGQSVVSNCILLCRPCELAMDSVSKSSDSDGSKRRILNFWVSRKLYDRTQRIVNSSAGLTSVSALVRYMMKKYTDDEEKFDDLEQYQDAGADVKINVWVDIETYGLFKKMMDSRNCTVTEGIKSLILTYESEVSTKSVERIA